MNALPVNYHLEVYEDSFMNDPVWHAEATNSFPALSIGDSFNHRGLGDVAWYTLPQSGQCFRIKDIEHIFWIIEGSHIGHKLMVALELGNIED